MSEGSAAAPGDRMWVGEQNEREWIRDEKIVLSYKEKSVSLKYIFEKLFISSVFIPLKNKISFKNLKLVKPNYQLPANFISGSFQVKFLPIFTANIGNSVTIPLILWESMGCKEMDKG